MACNIQIIFYRTNNCTNADNVLVKVLLNEAEATLPVKPSKAGHPYYNWNDLRKFYTDKINKYEASLQTNTDNEGK